MKAFRLSIGSLLLLILLLGVGLAGLTHPSETWTSVLFSALMLALLAAVVGVLLTQGHWRAFWVGFAVFGWGYWMMSSAPYLAQSFRRVLITDRLLDIAYPRLIDLPVGVLFDSGTHSVDPTKPMPGPAFYDTQRTYREFKDIGHHLTNLLVALAAGSIVSGMVARREHSEMNSIRHISPSGLTE